MSVLSGKHFLVVEDEYFIADEMVTALENVGAVIVGPFALVSEAKTALEVHVDLAMLDVNVRDGLTYPIATMLRSRAIPFIFATGQARRREPPEWHSAPWIEKPYSPADIIRLLASLKNSSERPSVAPES